MKKSLEIFNLAIKDAEELLSRFDNEQSLHEAKNSEVLKRAGIVMALAAWETYVKERFKEEIEIMLCAVNGSLIGNFVQNSVKEDLKRFYNPNSDRTKQLFKKYFEIDITLSWEWDNYQAPQVRKKLNELISQRGDAAHKSIISINEPHIVKRDELEKSIRFLKGLAIATDKVDIHK